MADHARNNLEDLEKYRLQLESNIAKLRKALQHWQTWEIEYESLSEDLRGLPANSSKDFMVKTARSVDGELLTVKEIDELLGQDKNFPRSAEQVVALISRRIEYVHRNVESLQKQVDGAELKLAGVSFVIQPEASTEEGLPVTDIYEELDEDGNTISGKIVRPGEAVSEVLDVLGKAGVNEEDLGISSRITTSASATEKQPGLSTEKTCNNLNDILPAATTTKIPAGEQKFSDGVRPRKKSVSFAEGTKEPYENANATPISHSLAATKQANPVDHSLPNRISPVSADQNAEDVSLSSPVIPDNESPEDVALRREMLQYHMSEVGAIVAQLDVDENADSDSEYDEDESNPDSISLTDDENDYGMSLNRGLDDKYTAEMMELERKLGAQMFQNIGPALKEDPSAESTEDERSTVLRNDINTIKHHTAPIEKNVRFSDKLDVAPATFRPVTQPERKSQPKSSLPMFEKVVERPLKSPTTDHTTPPTAKPSRFKAARMTNPRSMTDIPTTTDFPMSAPLASRIIERPPANIDSPARPSSPDEFDPALIRQQVTTEYYRQRNRMIQKEGGFTRRRQDEQEMDDLDSMDGTVGQDEDGDGGGNYEDEADEVEPERKVSLFKAARLKKAAIK